MKLIISFWFIFLNSLFLFSQETTTNDVTKEFGLDATFVNRFLPFDNVIGQTNDYLFSYRLTKDNGKFTRFGFDVDFAFDYQNDDNSRKERASRVGFDFRVGGGKTKSIYKKLTIVTGFDWLMGFSYAGTKIGDSAPRNDDGNRSRTYVWETGLGPFIGLQYNITNKFGIYTEADFYASLNYELSEFESFNQPRLDQQNEKVSFVDKIALPGTIVVFYKLN